MAGHRSGARRGSGARPRSGSGARRRGATILAACLAAAGCGGHTRPPRKPYPPLVSTLEIVAGLPRSGPVRSQSVPLLDGMRLALRQAGGRAGEFHIDLDAMDDAAPGTGAPDAAAAAGAALTAAEHSPTILYLGDMTSAATEVTLPILNEAGIPQLSPSSGYDGLTGAGPDTASGEPGIFYPSGRRTFARLVPRDLVQAGELLQAMRQAGCRRVALAGGGQPGPGSLELLLAREAAAHGLRVVLEQTLPLAGGADAFAHQLRRRKAGCLALAGTPAVEAVAAADAAGLAMPRLDLFTGSALCTASFVDAGAGGILPELGSRTQCTSPVPDLSAEPRGRAFLRAYRAAFGTADPDPYAALGYEAMRLALDTIARLGPQGEERQSVARALLSTRARASLLGTYSIDARGDTSLTGFGLYGVTPDGGLRFERMLRPAG
jgi:branched-chain amino acid transport system substrate-binding protein